MRKVIPAAVVAAALVGAPMALAAASPTVSASAATSIGQTYATLHGSINPNGLATTYQFDYGPTNALGKAVPVTAGSAGSGATAVTKSNRVGGLSPDTTYYYELVATNSDGSSTTPIESFKTTGNPAPTSTTDLATNVGRNFATLVGTIAPNNQATSYFFQYGLTSCVRRPRQTSRRFRRAPRPHRLRLCFRAWRRGRSTTSGSSPATVPRRPPMATT